MSKRLDDLGTSVDLKFDTEKIKARTNEILNANPEERKIFMRYKKTKIALIAAVITVLCIATAFAADGIISYFQSDKAVEITNVEELEKHNEKIGVSVSKNGYTLTLENIAADDNFLHVFYTITSQEGRIWENRNITPFVYCRVNGRIIGNENHSDMRGYYADDYTYKTVVKYNISQIDIPDKFLFEMYSLPNIDASSPTFEEEYRYQEYLTLTENLTLTDKDKEKIVYLSTDAKKSSTERESVTYDLNGKFSYKNYDGGSAEGEFLKAIFSPFGSQLVVKDSDGGRGAEQIMGMAMMDDKNNFLDILATDIGKSGIIDTLEESNSIEFIKGSPQMKYFTIVPVKGANGGQSNIKQKAGTYPLTYEINEYGKVIVTGISVKDGRIDVHYYKDGFVRLNPEFVFLDENGNRINFGNFPATYYEVHYDTNSYTASYYYNDYDENGKKPLPSDGSLSKESLEQRFVSLEVVADNDYALDYDNAIKIELK